MRVISRQAAAAIREAFPATRKPRPARAVDLGPLTVNGHVAVAEAARRGIAIYPQGRAFRLLGRGVDLLVATVNDVRRDDLEPWLVHVEI